MFLDINPCSTAPTACELDDVYDCTHNAEQSGSFHCDCKEGYKAIGGLSGTQLCEGMYVYKIRKLFRKLMALFSDIDECSDAGICSDWFGSEGSISAVCINQPGAYQCRCEENFARDENGKCQHTGGTICQTLLRKCM